MVGEIDSLLPFLRSFFVKTFGNTYVGGVILVLGIVDHGQKHYLNMGHLGSTPGSLHYKQLPYLSLLHPMVFPFVTMCQRRIYILIIGTFWVHHVPNGNGHWESNEHTKRHNVIHHRLSR